MEIRAAAETDISAIQQVAERSWEHDYPDILSRETAVEGAHEWYSEDKIEREFDSTDARIFLAERDDDVVGFVHTVVDGPDGDILRLYVDPDHRSAGLGTSLLDESIDYLFDQGVDRVKAMVLVDNEAGNEFYDGYGFDPAGESRETEIAGEFYGERTWVLE